MGAITSRQHAGVVEVDIMSNHAYKYPPRSGNYFGSHFIMGGERFDTPQPESYLFGENTDLNFLGSRPTPFPYPPPQPNEPTKTLKCLVNIRKESLRFIRAPIDYNKPKLDNNDGDVELGKNTSFNIEFTFDCDVRCAITIYYFAIEEYSTTAVGFSSRDSKLTSETYHYKRGANQQFCQMSHIFDPSKYTEDELLYDIDREVIPIAIHCVAEDGPDELRQSHTTIAAVDKTADGTYILKALKQKLFVDGLCYLLQEIYGIENKHTSEKQHRSHQTTAQNIADVATDVSNSPSGDTNDDHNSPPTAPAPTSSATPSPTPSRTPSSTEDGEDNGSECVICMCDVRDTLILPCRHLCLCNSCADSLRYQANNCPICRAPFRALLQVRALQKIAGGGGGGENRGSNATNAGGGIATAIGATGGAGTGSGTGSPPDPTSDNIPPGYQAVSLIEALNGPCSPRSTHITTPAQVVSVNTQAALVVQPAQHVTNMPDLVDTPDHDIVALHAAQLLNRPDHRNAKAGKNGYGGGAGGRQGLTADSPEFGMSVLVLRDEDNKETPKCPLLSESTITPRSKQNMKPRDTVRHINENAEKIEGPDEVDSEAEKSSPLLETTMMRNCLGGLTLNMADVEPIDDHDDDNDDYPRATSKLEKPKGYGRSGEERGDESDHFYTPEDPTAPLPTHTPSSDTPSNNHQPESGDSSVDGTPVHHASHQQLRGAGGLGTGASLLTPGTPASQVSTRSVDSRDSYSSSSGAGSTKHLLMDRGDRMVGERLSGGGDRNREVRL